MKKIIPLIILSFLLAGCMASTKSDALSLIVKQLNLKSDSCVREIDGTGEWCFIVKTTDGAVIYIKINGTQLPLRITERRWLFDGTNSNTTTESKILEDMNTPAALSLEKKE